MDDGVSEGPWPSQPQCWLGEPPEEEEREAPSPAPPSEAQPPRCLPGLGRHLKESQASPRPGAPDWEGASG